MEAWEQVEKTRAEAEANAWKDRLKEEYTQLKERYEKLRKFNTKALINGRLGRTFGCGETHPTHEECRKQDVREDLMREQESLMFEYLRVIERRAELEGIEL